MVEVVQDLRRLPAGSHCLGLHAGPEEAAEHAVLFIAGTPEGVEPSYWVGDPELADYYNERLAFHAPDHMGCVSALDREQLRSVDGRLRPVPEIQEFVSTHPEGVAGGADTISAYWTAENLPEHLEYEAWFHVQPRRRSRFLCPYDLRRIPLAPALHVLRQLGAHHSHVVLSASNEPAVRLLQLFVFATPADVPLPLKESHRWASEEQLLHAGSPTEPLSLTASGSELVRRWSEAAPVNG